MEKGGEIELALLLGHEVMLFSKSVTLIIAFLLEHGLLIGDKNLLFTHGSK